MHTCVFFLQAELGLISSVGSVVCAVQVKVEELEMETPIRPPESPGTAALSSVKEEEEEETMETDPRGFPLQRDSQEQEGAEEGPESVTQSCGDA